MLNLIGWIIVGALAGWLASIVMGTNSRQGCLTDIILGIVGGFVGGFVLNALNIGVDPASGELNLPSLLVAFIGAIIVLAVLRFIRRS